VCEEALRDFLAGRMGAWRLRRELADLADILLSEEAPPVEAMPAPFELFPRHLLALCEAVLDRELEPPWIPPLARWLRRSERFQVVRTDPDGRVVREVLVAWSEDGPLLRDPEDLLPFRDWLVTRRRPGRLDPERT
jgi:hypothetical protein